MNFLRKIFGGLEGLLSGLENDVSAIETDYELAAQRIQDARDWASEVAAAEARKFSAKKASIIARVQSWVDSLEESIVVDSAKLEAYYEEESQALSDKLRRVHTIADKASERANIKHGL